jgi:hypothetical protein
MISSSSAIFLGSAGGPEDHELDVVDGRSVGILVDNLQQSGEDRCRLEIDAGLGTQMFAGN